MAYDRCYVEITRWDGEKEDKTYLVRLGPFDDVDLAMSVQRALRHVAEHGWGVRVMAEPA